MHKPGDTIDRYTVDAVLGQGGMGCVYSAHDARLDRKVALKVISDGATSSDAKARLAREARAAAAFDHPNAVAIFDVGETNGAPYIVMELVSGSTLRALIGDASVPVATRIGWLTDVARALAAAHRRNLVHRDIKPENVMVRDDGLVKVLDFGIARRSRGGAVDPEGPTAAPALATLTKVGVSLGTPLYMAPEQIRGDALDGRADQFAWGVLAYELCTGRVPWRGGADPLATVASVLTDDVDESALDAAGLGPEVKAVVLRALAKRTGDRFASMDDVVRALDAARGDARSIPPASPERSVRPAAAPAAAPSATTAHRYSADEVRAILVRAIDQQETVSAHDGKLGFDDLLAAAREVGVDADTLREASRDLRVRASGVAAPRAATPDADPERDAWFRRKRRGWKRHLGVFLIVNTVFVLTNLLHGHLPGFPPPDVVWSIVLGIHGLRALTADGDDWQDEQERRQKRDRKRKRREETVSRVVDDGVSLLLQASSAVQKRAAQQRVIAASAEGPRVRFAVETAEREAAAVRKAEEEDAASAENASGARRARR